MDFIPGFAQVSSKGGLPITEGDAFPGLSSCHLHIDTKRLQRVQRRELAVGYARFHVAWALSELSWRQISFIKVV